MSARMRSFCGKCETCSLPLVNWTLLSVPTQVWLLQRWISGMEKFSATQSKSERMLHQSEQGTLNNLIFRPHQTHLKRPNSIDRVRDWENRAKVIIGPSTQSQIICLKTKEVCDAGREAIDGNIKWKRTIRRARANSTHPHSNRVKC